MRERCIALSSLKCGQGWRSMEVGKAQGRGDNMEECCCFGGRQRWWAVVSLNSARYHGPSFPIFPIFQHKWADSTQGMI
jgi:hypothetical protein